MQMHQAGNVILQAGSIRRENANNQPKAVEKVMVRLVTTLAYL